MRIKPGHGYYDVTTYPLGGSFHRAPDTGVELLSVASLSERQKGCDSMGMTVDGRKVCFDSANTDAGHAE